MSWLEYVENPKAITHLYDEVPPLVGVEVLRLALDRDGPTLTFFMDLPRFADHRPARWEPSSNTVQLAMDFYGVEELRIAGFPINPILDFQINRAERKLCIAAGGAGCRIQFSCLSCYIQKVSGYMRALDVKGPSTASGS
jgi:hypothetical protein